MAQTTKSRAPSARSKTTKATKRKAPANRKTSGSRARSTSRRRNGSSGNGAGSTRKAIETAAKQAGSAASDTGHSVGQMARKAKTPLLAGGAAVAGAAGGLALGARQARKSKAMRRQSKAMRRPMVKVDSHDLARAAKNVGRFGVEMGELASELRKNREETDSARRRSPIEVVLQGLTTRRG